MLAVTSPLLSSDSMGRQGNGVGTWPWSIDSSLEAISVCGGENRNPLGAGLGQDSGA